MTISRGAINEFEERNNCGANFRRALILGEHRIEEALSRFLFEPLKRLPSTWRAPDKGEDFSHD